MAIFDLFSKRQKRKQGEIPDIYIYNDIPNKLRVQIIHIINEAFGITNQIIRNTINIFNIFYDVLCKEYGVFYLTSQYENKIDGIFKFFLQTNDIEQVIDIIELGFIYIDTLVREYSYDYNNISLLKPDDAIKELNNRFIEHGIGYQYINGEIIRIDSQILHQNIIKPVLNLLNYKKFQGINDEYMKAHDHYRHKRYKESLNECLKSFESTLKVICDKNKWNYNKKDTAKKLIDIVIANNFFPSFLNTQINSLRLLLESGIPTIRNKLSGHGQGVQIINVPQYYASFLLHLTGSTILFLIEIENQKC